MYFPTFIWVVRDFTLQLVDSDGEPINSKEYLESALAPQKGVSENIESKNKIRRYLTSFFKERDCFTLVRPLTNEENLQNLDKMEFDKLRPEFFEQILNLRKRILNRMKPKSLNNKNLTGEMFSTMIKSYIQAINNGAVPNIENAWIYICKNECNKARTEALEIYEKTTKELLMNKIPTTLEEIHNYHKTAKETAIMLFKKRAIGDMYEEFWKELLKNIKQKYLFIKLENEKESLKVCSQFLKQEIAPIEMKLKKNEYKTFYDFEKDMKMFQTFFLESGPKTVNKQQIISDFIQKQLAEGASHFIRYFTQEAGLKKTISAEIQNRLEKELKELKENYEKEKAHLILKINQLENEKAQFDLKEQNGKEALGSLKAEKEKCEKQLRAELTLEKAEAQRLIQEFKNKLNIGEENMKEMERQILIKQSEFEKERSLLLQKSTFLEKQLEEINKNNKDSFNELKNTKKDHANFLKEVSTKYDSTTKNLQLKINELQEKNLEYESQLATKDQKYEMEKKKWSLNESNYTNLLAEANQTINNLQKEIKEIKTSEEKNFEHGKQELEKNIARAKERIAELESQLKSKEDQIKVNKSAIEKDKAILMQKIEFLTVALDDSKHQLEESKKAHLAMLNALDAEREDSEKVDSKQMIEFKEAFKNEIRMKETQIESLTNKFQSQIQSLTQKNNELELQLKLETSEYTKHIAHLKEQVEQSELAKTKLLESNKSLDSQKIKVIKETDERYCSKIKQLESQIEETKLKSAKEIKEIQAKSEESLMQLKNYFELEKERLEKRIMEEKDKADKKSEQLNEENSQKLKEYQENFEEENENLKEELRELETQNQNLIQQYEQEFALKQQTIDHLEKTVQDLKENLSQIQNSHLTNLDQQSNNFNGERKELLKKVESISGEITKKDKEILTIAQAKETAENMLTKKDAVLESLKKEFKEERKQLIEKIDDAKNKFYKANDDCLKMKIDLGKDLALSKQENEFLAKKIDDLKKNLDDVHAIYEEKLKQAKIEHQQELTERLKIVQDEKQTMESKHDKVKKLLKESESNLNKQTSQYEREKAILTEKLLHFESKKTELEGRLMTENQCNNSQMSELKERLNNEKKIWICETEKLKDILSATEQEKSEIITNYEKDKVLWEGKIQFLEQQKSQAKMEYDESIKKFEHALAHLKKNKATEKEETQPNMSEIVANIEKKYENQINEMKESHSKYMQDYENIVKKLEKDLKIANEKIAMESQNKAGNAAFMEKKLNEYIENEKKQNLEIDAIKQERDAKITDFQKQIDQERENYKQKLQELEQKFKESENKKTGLLFEHERERTKWQMEKDYLQMQKMDLQEALEKIEKKREMLVRENEKLKSEYKICRKNQTTINPNSSFIGGMGGPSRNNGSKFIPSSPFNEIANKQDSKNNSIYNEKNLLLDITNVNNENNKPVLSNQPEEEKTPAPQ